MSPAFLPPLECQNNERGLGLVGRDESASRGECGPDRRTPNVSAGRRTTTRQDGRWRDTYTRQMTRMYRMLDMVSLFKKQMTSNGSSARATMPRMSRRVSLRAAVMETRTSSRRKKLRWKQNAIKSGM